jgi:hypothetical protein
LAGARIEGFPFSRQDGPVKTTIDLPEPLYKRAKLRALERGITLKEMMIGALRDSLEIPAATGKTPAPTVRDRRKLLPKFESARRKGAFRPSASDRDVTDLISDDRDAR